MHFYGYDKCDTCRKAKRWLDETGLDYKEFDIRKTPPSKPELKRMVSFMKGDRKKLLNTSGKDYREMKLKDKLPELSDDELLNLLHENGNLIKRPFAFDKTAGTVGFDETRWSDLFL